MWINSVALDDFGCFDHARIDGMQDGVNVIAGPQRAGKTTFMQALRHLGYRIPRDGSVPPAANEYSLGAVGTTPDGDYRLDISGHGSPTATSISGGPDRSVEDLYAGLQKAQYHQLYTISLDELRQSPRRLDDDVNLAEVLLGGAFGDVIKLPELRDEFKRGAKSIGGKHGRAVYDLSDPIDRIEDGIENRNAATAQVDEHERVQSQITELSQTIESYEVETRELGQQQTLLDAVATCYDEVQRLRDVEDNLSDVDETELDAFPSDRVESIRERAAAYREARETTAETYRLFDAAVDAENTDAYLGQLHDYRSEIRQYTAELSGFRERHKRLLDERNELDQTWGTLEQRARELNAEWGDFDAVQEVDTDTFARDEVRRITSQYAEAIRKQERAQSDLTTAKKRVESLREELEDACATRDENNGISMVVVGGAALFGFTFGLGAGLVVGPVVGVSVTFLVLAVTGVAAFRRIGALDELAIAVRNLEADVRSANADVNQHETAVSNVNEALRTAEAEFTDFCEALGVSPSMDPQTVADFHDDIRDLQADINEAKRQEVKLTEDIKSLRADLEAVVEALLEVGALNSVADDPIDEAASIFATLERVSNHADRAYDVHAATRESTAARESLVDELSVWKDAPSLERAADDHLETTVEEFLNRAATVADQQKNYEECEQLRSNIATVFGQGAVAAALSAGLGDVDAVADGGVDDQSLFAHVETVFDEHGDLPTIEARLDEIESRLSEIDDKQERLRDERAELTNRLETLRSADDVYAAHETIQQGRQELLPLAEEYATNRIAQYFLDGLYEQYLEQTTGPLLQEASNIFERITDGTYNGIETQDELDDLDFTTLLENGATHTPSELSRATVEQLFLAIRIARIRQESQPLPVILDDSFTNFDPQHRQRTLQVVGELANTTQVFLLTCHPEVVEAASGANVDPKYWQLKNGTFAGPVTKRDVKGALRTENV